MKKLLLTGLISCLMGNTVAYSQGLYRTIIISLRSAGHWLYTGRKRFSNLKITTKAPTAFSFRRAPFGCNRFDSVQLYLAM